MKFRGRKGCVVGRGRGQGDGTSLSGRLHGRELRRKVRATADLLEKGAEFSSHLERKRGESATNIEDGGNARLQNRKHNGGNTISPADCYAVTQCAAKILFKMRKWMVMG